MPTIPSADPLPLPAAPSLLWFLLMLTFLLHVLAMNFVLGGSIIAAFSRERSWFAKPMPIMVAAAITFGVAPLLFLQALYGRLFFTSSVLMAWFWFAVVPLLIVAYYGTYAIAFRKAPAAIGIGVAVIFIAISFIYSNNMTLMLRPEKFLPMFLSDAGGTHLNLSDPTLVPRWLHMLFGAIAVAGAALALFGGKVREGAAWFGGATLVNMLTGAWWLGVLPKEVRPLTSISLAAGVLLGLVALGLMLRGKVVSGSVATLLTIAAMLLTRDEVRRGMLRVAGFQPATRIEPQWDVIVIFAVLLVAALATTAWMVASVTRARVSAS